MIAFVKGSVYGTTNDALILENHGIGYQIFTPDPKQYAIEVKCFYIRISMYVKMP